MMATRPFACIPKRRGQAICGLTSWQSKLGPSETPETRPFRGDRLHLTAEKRASLYIPPPSHCPSCPPLGFSRHLLLRLAISAGCRSSYRVVHALFLVSGILRVQSPRCGASAHPSFISRSRQADVRRIVLYMPFF